MNVTVRNLTKVYPRSVRALEGIDLVLGGGMTGLLGHNGAGKTTLMRILTGTVRPTSGTVIIGGHDLASSAGRTAVKRVLGYLPQDLSLYPDLHGREFLDYVALLKGMDDKRARRNQIDELLVRVGLDRAAKQRIAGYSGGMRRRLGIAQVLLGDPRLIIVDEPTAGLDPEERMRFRALLASLGGHRTVILSTHILDDVAQSCPHVAVLADGRLRYHGGTPGLVDAATGRTYLLRSRTHPGERFTVVNANSTPEGTDYRIITATPPAHARPVPPTLEDGYVALLQATRDDEQASR